MILSAKLLPVPDQHDRDGIIGGLTLDVRGDGWGQVADAGGVSGGQWKVINGGVSHVLIVGSISEIGSSKGGHLGGEGGLLGLTLDVRGDGWGQVADAGGVSGGQWKVINGGVSHVLIVGSISEKTFKTVKRVVASDLNNAEITKTGAMGGLGEDASLASPLMGGAVGDGFLSTMVSSREYKLLFGGSLKGGEPGVDAVKGQGGVGDNMDAASGGDIELDIAHGPKKLEKIAGEVGYGTKTVSGFECDVSNVNKRNKKIGCARTSLVFMSVGYWGWMLKVFKVAPVLVCLSVANGLEMAAGHGLKGGGVVGIEAGVSNVAPINNNDEDLKFLEVSTPINNNDEDLKSLEVSIREERMQLRDGIRGTHSLRGKAVPGKAISDSVRTTSDFAGVAMSSPAGSKEMAEVKPDYKIPKARLMPNANIRLKAATEFLPVLAGETFQPAISDKSLLNGYKINVPQGGNSFKGKVFEGNTTRKPWTTVYTKAEIVDESKSANDVLGISGEMSITYGPTSGKGGGDYLKSTVSTENSITLMYLSKRTAYTIEAIEHTLTEDAKALTPEQIFEQYGTMFVDQVQYGAYIDVRYTIESDSKIDQESIEANLSGSIGVGALDADFQAAFTSDQGREKSQYKMMIAVVVQGVDLVVPPNPSFNQTNDVINEFNKKYEMQRKMIEEKDGVVTNIPLGHMMTPVGIGLAPVSNYLKVKDAEYENALAQRMRILSRTLNEGLYWQAMLNREEDWLKKKIVKPYEIYHYLNEWSLEKEKVNKLLQGQVDECFAFRSKEVKLEETLVAPVQLTVAQLSRIRGLVGLGYVNHFKVDDDHEYDSMYYEGFTLPLGEGSTQAKAFYKGSVSCKGTHANIAGPDTVENLAITIDKDLCDADAYNTHPGFNLPPVPASNTGDTSFDLSKEVAGDFGIGDFHIEMDVIGKGFHIAGQGKDWGNLFIRSGEADYPFSGPTVFISVNGHVNFRLRADEIFEFQNALPNPKEAITRHLVFSRTGTTLQAVIDGTQYDRTITKEIDDIAGIKGAPLRFRGNHIDKTGQSLYMDVTNIVATHVNS